MKSTIAYGLAGLLATTMVFGTVEDLVANYRLTGAGPFSADAGRTAWLREHQAPDGGAARSCASCHGTDLGRPGRHVKTGKMIGPMALSAISSRLSDPKKVEKWFLRNCRWTLGRECTAQEKGDFIQFMSSR